MAMGMIRSSLKEKNNGRCGSFGSHVLLRPPRVVICVPGGAAIRWVRPLEMKRKAKRQSGDRRGGRVILALAAGLFVVLLLVRMLVFVVGRHGR
jgi:hypothetical protein